MDEKTEELRELFVDVTDEETVTERQEESRGSITGGDGGEEALGDIIARMREKYDFDTSLSDSELATVVKRFYRGDSDTEIAEAIDVSRKTVIRARLDVHLVRERDTDAPFDLSELRDLLVEDRSTGTIADELDVSPSTVRKYRRVVRAQNEARRVSDRYRSEFEDALVEADLDQQLTADISEDGLEEATEGMETDVSF